MNPESSNHSLYLMQLLLVFYTIYADSILDINLLPIAGL